MKPVKFYKILFLKTKITTTSMMMSDDTDNPDKINEMCTYQPIPIW